MNALRLTIFVAAIGGIQGTPASWVPDSAAIRTLESRIKPGNIPKWGNGHQPLVAEYVRYYTGYLAGSHRMIRGEFVPPYGSKMRPPGVYVVSNVRDFPLIFDGGCGIVNLIYDVDEARITSLQCNGNA